MGILPREEFDASVEYYSYEKPGNRVLMFPTVPLNWKMSGVNNSVLEQLLETAQNCDEDCCLTKMTQALHRFGGDRVAANDDIALMLAECEMISNLPVRKRQGKVLPHAHEHDAHEHVVWNFSLTLDIQQIKILDVVPMLLDIVQQVGKDKGQSGKIL